MPANPKHPTSEKQPSQPAPKAHPRSSGANETYHRGYHHWDVYSLLYHPSQPHVALTNPPSPRKDSGRTHAFKAKRCLRLGHVGICPIDFCYCSRLLGCALHGYKGGDLLELMPARSVIDAELAENQTKKLLGSTTEVRAAMTKLGMVPGLPEETEADNDEERETLDEFLARNPSISSKSVRNEEFQANSEAWAAQLDEEDYPERNVSVAEGSAQLFGAGDREGGGNEAVSVTHRHIARPTAQIGLDRRSAFHTSTPPIYQSQTQYQLTRPRRPRPPL